ncbi:GntP family permease [Dethiobacter alkaliphilus]|uniref:GntP family permease n=1 Tax=Dethiobacter alkaliphilus TaxID=427926 RepID=UPI0022264938|nr:GntP family permease [Dethiobacter alkaliphilus]MCW3490205.1 GntP family permease [Dethiobacter alkaliphilus]
MEIISVIGIIVSLALLVFLAMRGVSILIAALVCSVLVAITSGMDLMVGLGEVYMAGLAGFVQRFFLIFLLGAVFGKFMEDSGAARSIAYGLLNITGRDKPFRALLAIVLICAVLTYGGVVLFVVVFTVLPLARSLFKELNIHWSMVLGPIALGAATFTMTMLPGTPAIQNVIPMQVLGTPATAAPLVGMLAAVVTLAIGLFYIKKSLDHVQEQGLGYEEATVAKSIAGAGTGGEDQPAPNLLLSLVPPVVLLVVLNVLDNIILALVVGIVLAALLFVTRIPSQVTTLNQGAANSIMPLLNTCAVVGFGAIVAATVGYEVISAALLGMPGGPLVSLTVSTNVLAGVTGSASGGLAIALEHLAPSFLEMGVAPEVIHRISAIASGGLDALPHNGAVVTLLVATALTHKEGYKHVFWTAVAAPVVATVPAILLALAIY